MKRLRAPSPAMILATVALVIASTGIGYAASKINGSSIKKGSVPGNRIKVDSLGGKQVNESRLGTVPRASFADEAALAGKASLADRAGDSTRLAGREIVPLSFLAPKGTANTLIGKVGPLEIYAACSAGGQVSVSAASGAGGSLRFTVQGPNQSNAGGSSLSNTPNEFVSSQLYDRSPAGFAYSAGGRLITGTFMLSGDPAAISCMVSGQMIG